MLSASLLYGWPLWRRARKDQAWIRLHMVTFAHWAWIDMDSLQQPVQSELLHIELT